MRNTLPKQVVLMMLTMVLSSQIYAQKIANIFQKEKPTEISYPTWLTEKIDTLLIPHLHEVLELCDQPLHATLKLCYKDDIRKFFKLLETDATRKENGLSFSSMLLEDATDKHGPDFLGQQHLEYDGKSVTLFSGTEKIATITIDGEITLFEKSKQREFLDFFSAITDPCELPDELPKRKSKRPHINYKELGIEESRAPTKKMTNSQIMYFNGLYLETKYLSCEELKVMKSRKRSGRISPHTSKNKRKYIRKRVQEEKKQQAKRVYTLRYLRA